MSRIAFALGDLAEEVRRLRPVEHGKGAPIEVRLVEADFLAAKAAIENHHGGPIGYGRLFTQETPGGVLGFRYAGINITMRADKADGAG